MAKFGVFATKKEMTRMWIDGAYVPVTLLHIPEQEVVRYKTEEKDGYSALVLGLDKETSEAKKGQKVSYAKVAEFIVDPEFVQSNPAGTILTAQLFDGVVALTLSGYGKGKGFQ
jgi:large subunit ribosomal protein L3